MAHLVFYLLMRALMSKWVLRSSSSSPGWDHHCHYGKDITMHKLYKLGGDGYFFFTYLVKSPPSPPKNNHDNINNNLLLTEREGRTGEYWPEVVTVRTERSEARTKTTKGQYSTVQLEQARLVSCLLYGTLFLIVKCTSSGLHLKSFVFYIHLWNFRKNFNLFSFFW